MYTIKVNEWDLDRYDIYLLRDNQVIAEIENTDEDAAESFLLGVIDRYNLDDEVEIYYSHHDGAGELKSTLKLKVNDYLNG